MGRPLNKRFFGPGTAEGREIKVRFNDGTGEVDGYIVKQLGSKKFRVSNGTKTAICWMVNKDEGTLTAGEMNIVVRDDAGVVSKVVKITARKATVSAGGYAGWDFSASTTDGRSEIEEAPSAAPVAIADGSFIVGVEYEITTVGTTTTWTEVGATTGTLGEVFVATATGTAVPGNGFATPTADLGDNFV